LWGAAQLEIFMADHGEVEYATAEGNDLPAHEANYEAFVHLAYVGTITVINILIGLTIGGAIGHWLSAAVVIILAVIVGGYNLWSGGRTASLGMLALSALALLYNAYS
jgi:hypothetical protein